MDILLLNQYFSSPIRNQNRLMAILPLSLLHLSTFLKSKGIASEIIELGSHRNEKPIHQHNRLRFGVSDEKITAILKDKQPKIIGLSCMYSRHYIDVLHIVRLIKKVNPNITIVVGGNHATAFAEMVLHEPNIDFVVMGEGEITFFELCKHILQEKKEFLSICGLAFRNENGKVVKTQKRNLVQNLDELPMLDYSMIDIAAYLDDTRVSPFLMRPPSFNVISSRGCPGSCVFCTIKSVWGRSWRGRSPRHFVDEIEMLHNKFGIGEFAIIDDSASVDKKRWEDICDEIIHRKLNIKWTTPNGIAHWTLTKSILDKMKKSGCYRITFGIESGNTETRRFIGKNHNLNQANELIQYANNIGMWTICTNIIGFPYETRAAINDTVRFAKTSGTDFATFFLLSPHVTSDVYYHFRKEGLLNYDAIFSSDTLDEEAYENMEAALAEGGVNTKFFTFAQLKTIQMKAYRSFILYRGLSFLFTLRLLRKIHNKEDFLCVVRYMATGSKIFINSFFKKDTNKLLYD